MFSFSDEDAPLICLNCESFCGLFLSSKSLFLPADIGKRRGVIFSSWSSAQCSEHEFVAGSRSGTLGSSISAYQSDSCRLIGADCFVILSVIRGLLCRVPLSHR